MKSLKFISFVALATLLMASNCGGDGDIDNPFENPEIQPPPPVVPGVNLDPTSIQGLHHNIFRPTCANSGCHDGTFEPDFRNIYSAYNTLVMRDIIKNNPSGDYEKRVVPNDPENSVLMVRLTQDIDGISGIMPLVVDPDGDWNEKKDEHIANIREWISKGAKDAFGDSYNAENGIPQMLGVSALKADKSLIDRLPGNSAIIVNPSIASMQLVFAFGDRETNPEDFTVNEIKFSTLANDFSNADAEQMSISPEENIAGYFGDVLTHSHKFVISDIATLASPGEQVYFRVYIKDEHSEVTEIPNDDSPSYIKEYFSFIKE